MEFRFTHQPRGNGPFTKAVEAWREAKVLVDGNGEDMRQHERDLAVLNNEKEVRLAEVERLRARFEHRCWATGWIVLFICITLIVLHCVP